MAGIVSQLFDKALEKVMKNAIEKIWPKVQYLIDRAILIPTLAIGAIVAGYKYEYLTGDVGVYGVVAIVFIMSLVQISKIFNRKGTP